MRGRHLEKNDFDPKSWQSPVTGAVMRDGPEKIVSLSEAPVVSAQACNPDHHQPIDIKHKIELRKLALDRTKLAIEKKKLDFEIRKFENEAHHRRATQTNQYATIAIRNVVLINGAAAIATLTYFGNMAKNGSAAVTQSASSGSLAFVVGVFTASMCTTLAYAARATHKGTGKKPRLSIVFEGFGWLCGLIALFSFPIGAYSISNSIDLLGRSDVHKNVPWMVEMQALGIYPDLPKEAADQGRRKPAPRAPQPR